MELKKEKWTKKDYQEYLQFLKSFKEEKYQFFQKKLIPTQYEILGVRVPLLRKMAKEIGKGNALSFLQFCGSKYYEEVMIEGLVIAGFNEEDFAHFFSSYLFKIDNWAICDSVCSRIQCISSHPQKYFSWVISLLSLKEVFVVRVGLVLLLSFYLEEAYLDAILQKLDVLSSRDYYVQMAMAWLLSEIYIRFPQQGLLFLKKNHLSCFVQNKTISKIRDSYRVSKTDKDLLLEYRKSVEK